MPRTPKAKFWIAISIATASILAAEASHAQSVAVGSQFQVNSYTTSYQNESRVGFQPDGSFVVVWVSGSYFDAGIDGDASGISLQRYASDGATQGSELQVNTYTPSPQGSVSLAVAGTGDFIVVWDGYGSAGTDVSSSSIHGRRFASSGAPIGDEFQVNDYTTNRQRDPWVAADAMGNFVVVWEDLGFSFPFDGQDGSSVGVFGRRFDSVGAPNGAEFQVNTFTTDTQYNAAVSAAANGDFVVIWQYRNDTDPEHEIRGQRFSSNATPLGGEFEVNTYTTGSQTRPTLAMAADGAFTVSWVGYGSASPDVAIQARRYDSAGLPLAGEFQVSTYDYVSNNDPPALAMAQDGGFVVSWASFRQTGGDTDLGSIQARRVSSSGAPIGEEFLINSYTTDSQIQPAVGFDTAGNHVVVWSSVGSAGTDSDSLSVQAQRFTVIVFADGFESGDTTLWSSSVP